MPAVVVAAGAAYAGPAVAGYLFPAIMAAGGLGATLLAGGVSLGFATVAPALLPGIEVPPRVRRRH